MKFLTTLILFSLGITFCYAQGNINDDGSIENREIIIEKNKKITFPEIKRTSDKISPPKKTGSGSEPPVYDYKELNVTIPPLDTKIKIATIKDEMSAREKDNYVRGGIGNYGTTYLEAGYFYKPMENMQLGFHGKHLASINGPTNPKGNSGNSYNFLEANGKYYFKKAVVSTTLDYTRTLVHFYGYAVNGIKKSESEIRQIFPQFSIRAEIQKVDSNMRFDYNVKANYFHISDHYKAKEGELYIETKTKYDIDKISKAFLTSSLSLSTPSDSLALSRTLFTIRPEYERLLLEKLTIKGGFNIAYDSDSSNGTNQFHIYPVIHGEYTLNNKLKGFLGLDGGMEKNTLRNFISQNPFLAPNVKLLHTNKKYEFYGGLKGNITPYLYFQTSPSIAGYQNLSLFINHYSDSSKFSVVYDGKTSTLFKFSNEIAFETSQKFKLGLRSVYYNYSMGTFEKAWHRPNFETTLYGTYNLYDKLVFGLDIFYISGINAKNFKSGKEYDLDAIIDINIIANYKITNRFSAFLYFYNLLSNNYMRYNYYPIKGINILGGITYTF